MDSFSVIRKAAYWKPALSEHYRQTEVKSGGKEHLIVLQIGCNVKWERQPFVFSNQPKRTHGFTHILPEVLLRPARSTEISRCSFMGDI
jgi:hypothetical protein